MKLETQCPKCGNNVFNDMTSIDMDSVATCAVCGNTGKLGEFLTPASKDSIMKAAKEAAIQALKNIPGFKKR